VSGTVAPLLRGVLLDQVFRLPEGVVGPYEAMWLAMTSSVAPANAGGDELREPTRGGYGRVEVAMGEASWDRVATSVLNSGRIYLPVPSDDWGLVAGWALCDTAEGGSVLAVGSLIEPTQVLAGIQPVIEPRTLVVSLVD
jgi:hypothetical protein